MKVLTYKWTISRGRETYGYNICTLWDGNTPYRCNGGGYDMQGSVFGLWLWANYKDRLESITLTDDMSGLCISQVNMKRYLDGACGLESMKHIAIAIGLKVHMDYKPRGGLLNIIVTEGQV